MRERSSNTCGDTLSRAIHSASLVFAVVWILHGITTRFRPLRASDTVWFERLADQLATDGLAGLLVGVRWSRIGFISFVALAKPLLGEGWPYAVLLLNITCDALLGLLVVRTTLLLTRSARAGWIALVLYLGAFEIFLWTKYVLSDASFAVVAFAVFWLMVRLIIEEGANRARLTAWLVAVTVVGLLLRPTMLIVVPLLIIGLVWSRHVGSPRTRVVVALGISSLVLGIFVFAAIMQRPDRWSLPFWKRQVAVFSQSFADGEVVRHRQYTYRPKPVTVPDFAMVIAHRFVRFFQFVTSGFSRSHNLFNAGWFIPVYLLIIVTIWATVGARWGGPPERMIIWYSLLWIAAFALFHSVTLLDFDWRYRMPVIPLFVVLASVGANLLIRTRLERSARSS